MLEDILNQPFKADNLDGLLDGSLPKQKLPPEAVKMFNKGAMALKSGDLATATSMFSKIMHIKPDHLPTIEAMGICTFQMENYEVATNFFKALNEMAPTYIPGYIKLGTIYALQEMTDEAEKILKQGLIIAPEDKECLNALAYIYNGTGQKEKAEKAFKKLLSLNPEGPSALYSYSKNIYKYKDLENDPHFKTLKDFENNIKKHDTRSQQEILATLAKAYADVKDYDTAFSYYRKAAETKMASLNFEPERLLKSIRMLEEYFDKSFFKALKDNNTYRNPSKEPVFICGFPRSGTTLLEQIMHSHPDMHGIGESGFLYHLFERNRLFLDYQGKSFPIPFSKEAYNKAPLSFEAAGQKYIGYLHTYKKRMKRYVNKAISNMTYVGAVYTLFPNAKFIHIKRNPLDSCLSCYMQQFNGDVQPYTYDLKNLGLFYQTYDKVMEYWKTLIPESIMTITYEELVNDTETKAKEVIEFVDLPWDERCLQFHQVNKFVKTASVSQVRKPVYKTAQNKWKPYAKHLTPLVKALGDYAPEDSLYLLEEKAEKETA